ncbi:LysE family transporter [Microbispora rosea]|uniref:LysE family transporter n=1 Tax=Microbispora rosea TaxID=58117 RepID=UPI0034230676
MDVYGAIASFAAIVALFTLTPGLDTALILRTSLLAGRRPAWAVVLGIQLGTLLWGLLTAAGLSALLTASQVAYEVVWRTSSGGRPLASLGRNRAPNTFVEQGAAPFVYV